MTRRTSRWWIRVLRISALVLVLLSIGGYLWVRFWLSEWMRISAEQLLWTQLQQDVTIGRVHVSFFPPRLIFRDVAWYTEGPRGRQIFARIPEIVLDFWFRPIIRRHLVIRSIHFRNARIHVYYDVHARANWPQISIRGRAGVGPVRIHLERIVITGLAFYLRHDGIPLFLGLSRVHGVFQMHAAAGHLDGGVQIDEGFLQMYAYNPWIFRGGIHARLTLQGPYIDFAHLFGDRFHVWGSGRVVGYGSPRMDLTLWVNLDNRVVQHVYQIPFRVQGHGIGMVHYDGDFSRFRMTGWLRSIPFRMGRQVMDDLVTPVHMTERRLRLYGGYGTLTGSGRFVGDFRVDPLFGTSAFRLRLAVDAADADRFGQMWGLRKIHHRARWGGMGGIHWLEDRFDALTGWVVIHAVPEPVTDSPVRMAYTERPYLRDWAYPVALHARGELEGYRFRHLVAEGQIGQTRGRIDGWIAFDGALDLRVEGHTASIYELDVYYHQWEWNLFPPLRDRIRMWEFDGRATFVGTFSHRVQDIAIDGHFRGERIRYLGVLWGDGETDVRYWHRIYAFRNASIWDGTYRVEVDEALIYLGMVDFLIDGDTYAEIRFLGYPVERVLAPTPLAFLPLRGTLRGLLTVRGNYQQVDLEGDLNLTEGYLGDLDLEYGILRFSYINFLLQIDVGRVGYRSGVVDFSGQWHRMNQTFQAFSVRIRNLPLARTPWGQVAQIAGVLDLWATLNGPWTNPRVDLHGHLEGLRWRDLALGDWILRSLPDRLGLAIWWLQDNVLRGRGELTVDARARAWTGTWEWRGFRLPGPFGARLYGRIQWDGVWPLSGSPTWTVSIPDGRVTIRQRELRIRTREPMRYTNGRVVFSLEALQAAASRIALTGWLDPWSIPVQWHARIAGTTTLEWIQDLWPGVDVGGQVAVQMEVDRRSTAGPTFRGWINITRGWWEHASWPMRLTELDMRVRVDTPTWQIERLQAQVGEGRVRGEGQIVWRPPQTVDFVHLNLQMDGATVRFDPFGAVRISGTATWTGYPGRSTVLNATWTVDEGQFTWTAPLGGPLPVQTETSGPSVPGVAVSGTPFPLGEQMQLNIRWQTRQPVRMRIQMGATALSADMTWVLHVIGTPARPIVLGAATLQNGQVILLNRPFDIQEGQIQFTSPLAIRPIIRLVAETRVQNYLVHATITGPVQQLSLRLTSDPPLPPRDILRMLGGQVYNPERPPQEATGFFTSLGSSFIISTLARSIPPISRAQQLFGIDRLTLDVSQLGPEARLEPRLTIGKQFGTRWSLTYSIGLTTTQTQILLVEYWLNRAVRLILSRDEFGEWGVDMLFQP